MLSTATHNRLHTAKMKSRGGFSILSQMDLLSISRTADSDELHAALFGDDDEEDDVPIYKREQRYHSLPIVIAPVINGEDYTVRVHSRNYSGIRSFSGSDFVTPRGVPPQPTITQIQSLDSEVRVCFECDDYSTLEYRAMYEVQSTPKTVKTKTRRLAMKAQNLENGQPYSFKVRGINNLGKGPWSAASAEVKPLK